MQEKNISTFNFEQCQKCAICNTVCPVLSNIMQYPGPKQSGPDGQRYRLKNSLFFDDTLKLCLNCKRCEVACPSNVKVGDIIQSAKINFGKGPSLRDITIANTDFVGSISTTFAPLVNAALGLSPVRSALDALLKVSKHAPMPAYSSQTFVSWFKKNMESSQKDYPRQVSYFHGCYANYNYPQLGKDFVTVMNALGYGVSLLDGEKCCGVAKLSNGMASQAAGDARKNISLIENALKDGKETVTVSSSCTLTILEEYPSLLNVDNSSVKDHISLFERFLYKAIEQGTVKLSFKRDYKAKVAYHCPCHQQRLGWGIYTVELLKMIPGVELTVLDSNCCGMAGTYGFKKENYETSQKIGKPLFDQIRTIDPDYVACECETCKWQIEASTGVRVMNPVSILAEALDIEATSKQNI